MCGRPATWALARGWPATRIGHNGLSISKPCSVEAVSGQSRACRGFRGCRSLQASLGSCVCAHLAGTATQSKSMAASVCLLVLQWTVKAALKSSRHQKSCMLHQHHARSYVSWTSTTSASRAWTSVMCPANCSRADVCMGNPIYS